MEIKQLKIITPAEALLLIHGSTQYLQELIKLTFIHLAVKKVFKITEFKPDYLPDVISPVGRNDKNDTTRPK